MNQKNKVLEEYGLWAADLAAVIISFLLATYIRFGNMNGMRGQDVHFLVMVCFLFVSTIYSFFLDWNRNFVSRGYGVELSEVLKYNLFMLLIVEAIMFFKPAKPFGNFSPTIPDYFSDDRFCIVKPYLFGNSTNMPENRVQPFQKAFHVLTME